MAEGFISANWDVAVSQKNKKMGIGIVIRDSMGETFAYLSSPKPFQSQHLLVECWALRRAIDLCTALGLQRVHLEEETHVVINVIQSKEANCSRYGSIIEDVKTKLGWKPD